MHQELYAPDLRGSQTWLTSGITCGALKPIPRLGHTANQLNQILWGWCLDIRVVQKLPKLPSGAAMVENYCLTGIILTSTPCDRYNNSCGFTEENTKA